MPDWWTERGIGEIRRALIQDDSIIEARIELEGAVRAGSVVQARLIDKGCDNRNAVASDAAGTEYLLPRGAPGVAEGASLAIEVTREAIPGAESWKRPMARVSAEMPRDADPQNGHEAAFPSPANAFGLAGWDDLLEEARSGVVAFTGGELRISPTPAMTLIDVDGHLPPDRLAIVAAGEAAKAIRRLDIGGSIGIDLPTAESKTARLAAAAQIDRHLSHPFERTAVNGFGFVQIVRPRRRASLVELAQDRAAFEARALLRRAALDGPSGKRLVAHPAVIGIVERAGDWTERLSRQVGGSISLRADAAVPMSGGYAETV